MTRCKAFYRKVRQLEDMEEVMKFCGKQDNVVYKIKAHMDFMDKHFPEWDREECTIVQLSEGATRELRKWERKDPDTFDSVLSVLNESDVAPTGRHVKTLLAKTKQDRVFNEDPEYFSSTKSWAEKELAKLHEEVPAIISRYDTIRAEIDKWEERWHPMEHVQIDREGNITCNLSLCENYTSMYNAKNEIGHIRHFIWITRPEKEAEWELSKAKSEIQTILQIFLKVCLAEKRTYPNIGLTRPSWSTYFDSEKRSAFYKDYTAEELRMVVQEAVNRLIQDYSALLEERETVRQKLAELGVS